MQETLWVLLSMYYLNFNYTCDVNVCEEINFFWHLSFISLKQWALTGSTVPSVVYLELSNVTRREGGGWTPVGMYLFKSLNTPATAVI